MMTTLRRDRRTQRTAKFNLESLDDRIVPSAMGAHAAVEGAHPMVNHRGAEKAFLAHERLELKIAKKEARMAKREARLEARLARIEAKHAGMMQSPISTAINMQTSVSAPTLPPTAAANGASSMMSSSSSPSGVGFHLVSVIPTAPNVNASSPSPLPSNVSGQLQSIYQQFVDSGGGDNFTPTGVNGVVISGSNVGINVHVNNPADFDTILAQLQSDGLQVTTSSAAYGIIDGMVSIAQLPTIAQISSNMSLTPIFNPTLR
jgi:hypothetical protein